MSLVRPFGVEAVSADDFALRALKAVPEQVVAIVRQQAADLKNPPYTVADLVARFEANGLTRFVAELRRLAPT